MPPKQETPDKSAARGAAGAETVVAVATAAGEGAIGIVRLSGPDACAIAGSIFRSRGGKPFADAEPWRLVLGRIIDGQQGTAVDEVLAVRMPGPRSFTGEDLVEFHGHGSPFLLESIVQAAMAAGARPAGPGEFTRRAFLNGRLDLSQAEAVMDLIRARGERSREAALAQLDGGLSRKLRIIDDLLVRLSAPLEAAIEFGDEERIDLEFNMDLLQEAAGILQSLVGLAGQGRAAREGLLIVFSGKTNAGKSSIINRLSGSNRSIVTAEAGTTRDSVESPSHIDGFAVTYVDTAGFGDAAGPAEEEGMRRSREISRRADMVIPVFDISRPLEEPDHALVKEVSPGTPFALLNKCDLEERLDRGALAPTLPDLPLLPVSALRGDGFDGLERRLAEVVHRRWCPSGTDDTLLANARHSDLLAEALASLQSVRDTVPSGGPIDLAAADLAGARSALGKITGRDVRGDLLDEIFSRFCIGK